MRGVEGQPRLKLIQPFTRVVDRATRRGDTSLLVREDRKNLRDYRKQLKQAANADLMVYTASLDGIVEEERERRAKEPKPQTHIEMNGKKVTLFEYFISLVEEQERLEQEAAA